MHNRILDFLNENKKHQGHYNRVTLLKAIGAHSDDLELEIRGLHLAQLHLKYSDFYVFIPISTTGLELIQKFHHNLSSFIFTSHYRELVLNYLTTNANDANLVWNREFFLYNSNDLFSTVVYLNPHLEGRFYELHNDCILFSKPREYFRLSKNEIYKNRHIYRLVRNYIDHLSKEYIFKSLDFSEFIFFKDSLYIFEGIHSIYPKNIEKKEFNCCTNPSLRQFSLDELLSTDEYDNSFYYICKNCNKVINIKDVYNFDIIKKGGTNEKNI